MKIRIPEKITTAIVNLIALAIDISGMLIAYLILASIMKP